MKWRDVFKEILNNFGMIVCVAVTTLMLVNMILCVTNGICKVALNNYNEVWWEAILLGTSLIHVFIRWMRS